MKIISAGGSECFEDLPIHVNWPLTRRCNYRCTYCMHYGVGKTPPPQLPFSTLEQLRIAVDNIASLNRPWYNISFNGGEPTIHPHLFELIDMLHKALGERINRIMIVTNGSRNEDLYKKIAVLAKSVNISLIISIHTDHVEMSHILDLIESLSSDVDIRFALMFNPAKLEMVHEIYDTLFEYRKKFWFNMSIDTIHTGKSVDPRYTKEDFAWQKEAMKKYSELVKTLAGKFPPRRKWKYDLHFIRTIEDNGEIKTVRARNRALELADGWYNLKGMYCVAYCAVLYINVDGSCTGMVCANDRPICNIYDKNCFQSIRDKLIHVVKCTRPLCACNVNDCIPKFASEEEAKKFLEFAQKRQRELFAEYDAAHSLKTI